MIPLQTKTVSGRTWHFSHNIGWLSARGRGFWHPISVAMSGDGRIYVLNSGDRAGAAITVTNLEEEFIGEFADEDFTWPQGLAVDADGNIYCSESFGNFINVYNPNGEKVATWGEVGSGDGQFDGPAGLTFDKEDNLWVVDSRNSRIKKFTKDGAMLSSWGSHGCDEGEFDMPWGISLDSEGYVYVADWGNNRVQKFTQDGQFVQRFGSLREDGGQLDHPTDVAVDSEGDVYVADWGNDRLQIFYPDGEIIAGLYGDARVFSKWAQDFMDSNPDYVKAYQRVDPVELVSLGRFRRPAGIVIDDDDRIVVTDAMRCRLQIYFKDKDYLEPQYNL